MNGAPVVLRLRRAVEPIDDATRAALIAALRKVGLADAPDKPPADGFAFQPLAGGLGRRAFLASCGEHQWVVRLAGADRAGALDLVDEARITAEAASFEIAPRVVACDEAAGVLVTEHLRGARPVDARTLKSPEGIRRAAALLKRLHRLRIAIRPFDPERFAAQYLSGACAEEHLDERHRRLARELRALAREYRRRYPSIVVCHNDLVPSNILDDGRLRLVDFEYAVLAAPILDLAGLAASSGFDAGARRRLVEAYYGSAPAPFTLIEFDRVVRLVRLLGYFWALHSASTAADRAPYEAFARQTAATLDA